MQSRVRRRGIAAPPRFGGVAALTFADQHQPRCPARLGRQLQAASCGQRQGLLRFGDDQRDGGGAQGLLDAPQKVSLVVFHPKLSRLGA